jgi:ribosome biogenesis GTPase
MREIQLWDGNEGIKESFEDIETLAQNCKFNDCQHDSEPGCAVKEAIEQGDLTEKRLESYRKLERELLFIERKKKYGTVRAAKLMNKDLFGF